MDDSTRAALEAATDAFWATIAEHFPTATTGDLSPTATVTFDYNARMAVVEWVENNVPSAER